MRTDDGGRNEVILHITTYSNGISKVEVNQT